MNDLIIFECLSKLKEAYGSTPRVEIANYKKLCELLDWDVTGGKKKKLQLEDLKRYCAYHKEGHKFIIDEIYDKPIEKFDKRKDGPHKIYVTLVESILLSYFIEKNLKSANFLKRELWEILGLTNNSYRKFEEHQSALKNELMIYDPRINEWYINNFYFDSRQVFTNIVNSALKSLSFRKLIEYDDNVMVAKKMNASYFEVKDDTLKAKILEIEKEALEELNCKSMIDVYFNKDKSIKSKFESLKKQKLKKRLGLQYVYKRYHIICNQKYLEQGLVENIEELKLELNDLATKKVFDVIQRRYQKANEEQKGKTGFKYYPSYMDIQKLLAKILLTLNEENIQEYLLLHYEWSADALDLFA